MRVPSSFRGAACLLLCLSVIAAGCQTYERPGELRPPAGTPESVEQPFLVRARDLHERIITIDSHSDLLLESCGTPDHQVDVPKMTAGGLDAVFEIVFTGQVERTKENREEARRPAMPSGSPEPRSSHPTRVSSRSGQAPATSTTRRCWRWRRKAVLSRSHPSTASSRWIHAA